MNPSLVRRFIDWNRRASNAFDQLLPADYRVDGNHDFRTVFVAKWTYQTARVVDVGGGKHPFFSLASKRALGLHVLGLDIDAKELDQAPEGVYDDIQCADVAKARGIGDADLCICQAVLEHVQDVHGAFRAIHSFLRPGGVALIFVPSRNAVFARLNLLLPERTKRWILHSIFPQTIGQQGFRSYYRSCTPAGFKTMAEGAGFEILEMHCYWVSAYFTFFAPLHICWRAWIICGRRIFGSRAAETFSMAIKRVS